MKQYYILFKNHDNGMRLYNSLKSKNIKATIAPTPRVASKSCGISILINKDDLEKIREIAASEEIDIIVENNFVSDFIMNDKCSAGTGKFIEVMANRLGVTIDELFDMAKKEETVKISSLCTVFAESEVISFIGKGAKREDIAAGVVDSVASKVATLCNKKKLSDKIIITGGISHNEYFANLLSKKLKKKVECSKEGRYAGALGAALLAKEL